MKKDEKKELKDTAAIIMKSNKHTQAEADQMAKEFHKREWNNLVIAEDRKVKNLLGKRNKGNLVF